MTAKTASLVVDRGTTFRIGALVKMDGLPVDLTAGFSGRLVVMRNGGAVVHTQEADMGVDGWARATVPDETTLGWPVTSLFYRVELDHPNGERDFLLMGPLRVRSGSGA